MKKILLASAVVILLAALYYAPVARACSQVCGYGTGPDGEPLALCLTVPSLDAYKYCFEINGRDDCGCGFHECYTFQICRNGYPIN